MNVLVLVGSLRAGSTNHQLADAAIAHLPSGVDGTVFARLADLPHYSEDLDHDDALPQVARDLREAVEDGDQARVQELIEAGNEANTEADQLAADLGLEDCGSD